MQASFNLHASQTTGLTPGRPLPWFLAALILHGCALAWLVRWPALAAPTVPTVMSVALVSPVPTITPNQPPAAAKPLPLARPTPPVKALPAIPASFSTAAAPAPDGPVLQAANATPITTPAAAVGTAAITAARFDADYLQNPAPIYPRAAKRMGEQGRVMLRAHVLPSGQPESVEVKATSGSPRLDEAALEAVRRWRFVPAHHGDQAVSSWVVIPISFSLEN